MASYRKRARSWQAQVRRKGHPDMCESKTPQERPESRGSIFRYNRESEARSSRLSEHAYGAGLHYKHYIFGLLFYKRLCDVWEEEYEQRMAQYDDAALAADPEEHRFHIPEGHFWKDVRKHTSNIGEHLFADLPNVVDDIATDYTNAEIRRFRKGSTYTSDMIQTILSHVVLMER